jgi:glucose-6-phosphate 1-dehydrogenase
VGYCPQASRWSASPAGTGSIEDFGKVVHDSVKAHARTPFKEEVWRGLAEGFRFVSGSFDDDDAFDLLAETLAELDESAEPAATTPSISRSRRASSRPSADNWSVPGLSTGPDGAWRRVVIEKPFGHDLASARELEERDRRERLPSGRRVPHRPLPGQGDGPEPPGRSASPTSCSSPIWNATTSDHVQITMAEDIGIGGRAGYYDGIGAARDVIQNHLLQLLALTAMEEPTSFAAGNLRAEKEKVLAAVRVPPTWSHTARGQYAAGWQGANRSRVTSRKTASPDDSPPRRMPRSASTSTIAAGRACRSTCAPASGCQAGHRDRARLQGAPHLPFTDTDTEELGPTRWSCGSSPTRV